MSRGLFQKRQLEFLADFAKQHLNREQRNKLMAALDNGRSPGFDRYKFDLASTPTVVSNDGDETRRMNYGRIW